jgi:hypothetical protein
MQVLLLLQGPGSYQSHRSVGWGCVIACSVLIFHRTLDYLGDWGGVGVNRLRCSSQSRKRVGVTPNHGRRVGPVRGVLDISPGCYGVSTF